MDLRVLLLCIVATYGKSPEYSSHQKVRGGLESKDVREQSSNVKEGFVQPLDFRRFTQQFVGEEKEVDNSNFGKEKTSSDFGEDSKKSGAFQIPNSEFTPFPNPIFGSETKTNKTGFVQPIQFHSSFDQGSSSKIYKTNIRPSQKQEQESNDRIPRATEEENAEDSYDHLSSRLRYYRQPRRPKKPYAYGKSSYPPPQRKTQSSDYYPISQHKDVEMILPEDKVLFLPMVNGKPKPYDGYRAAPELEGYESSFDKNSDRPKKKESIEEREKRLSEGEIIYGKPKIPLSKLHHRHLKRSPAEYQGGIYPYYDYSDAKLSGNANPSGGKTSFKQKKTYPKKHKQRNNDKQYNPYKYPKENTKRRNKNEDSEGYASDENSEEIIEEESEEEAEETKRGKPFYKYTYDDSIKIPPLLIKKYPYERRVVDHRDSEGQGTSHDYEDDNVDEYTASYEKYIKTLPSDLEAYFGTPDGLADKFSVEATQNLEQNKNCKKVEAAQPQIENSEKTKEAEAQTQVCYICSDPETGDNYEQCAYKSQPKNEKYFFGGSTSFQTNDTEEPQTYRYKRSTYESPRHIDPYSIEESDVGESRESLESQEAEDPLEEYYRKPRKKSKKYKKQRAQGSNLYGKKHPKKSYDYDEYNPYYVLHGESTSKKGRAARLEEPPKSYDGPKYTYEGPEDTYEGPSQPYEGPKQTYEGPAEPYEGPINQEYYDTSDERIEDDEEESSNQETQTSAPTAKYYKPKKRQSYYYPPSRYSEEEYRDTYQPPESYTSNYRFGPEHFVEDEGEPEDTKHTEQIKPKAIPKTDKRGPHKFPPSESRASAASDKQEKEEPIGDVKVFKNGDICQKKKKEGMICMVCKNEKTQATYEQCQYSTKPKEKYFAYGSQKSYTTKNPTAGKKEEEVEEEPDTDQYPEKSDIVEKKILITTQSKVFGYDPTSTPAEGLVVAESKNSPRLLTKDLYGDYTDNIETSPEEKQQQNDTSSQDFIESIERIEPRDGIEGLEEYLYDAEDSEKKASEEEKQSYKSYDDYFHDLFPDFAKNSEPVPESEEKEESESEKHLIFDPFSNIRRFHEENSEDYPERYSGRKEEEEEDEEKDAEASRPEELRLKDRQSHIPEDFFVPYNEENHKKDLEKALGEFQNKDWSNCKKIVKKKLTCYQCVDKNGVNNEECMYVEASQPISKHLAYHEKKELKPGSDGKNKTGEPSTEAIQSEKALRRFRKAKNSQEELIDVSESPKDVEYVGNSTSKGDFEGVEKPAVQEAETSQQLEKVSEVKRKARKEKRHPKKRNKTIKNETTTERFEKVRKRKFPLKKFAEVEVSTPKTKAEEGSFGMKKANENSNKEFLTNTTQPSPS